MYTRGWNEAHWMQRSDGRQGFSPEISIQSSQHYNH